MTKPDSELELCRFASTVYWLEKFDPCLYGESDEITPLPEYVAKDLESEAFRVHSCPVCDRMRKQAQFEKALTKRKN